MSANLCKISRIAMLAAAISAWSVGGISTSAHAQHMMHQHGIHADPQQGTPQGHQHATSQPDDAKQAVIAPPGPHGGRMTTMSPLMFEVVYQPKEIRVYFYGQGKKPQSARDAKGEITMRHRDNSRVSHVALQYATPQSGSSEQDYLAASADLSNVKDGEMTATFKLESLPSQRSTAMFGQPITLSKVKPRVTLACLAKAIETVLHGSRSAP